MNNAAAFYPPLHIEYANMMLDVAIKIAAQNAASNKIEGRAKVISSVTTPFGDIPIDWDGTTFAVKVPKHVIEAWELNPQAEELTHGNR